MRTLDWIVMQKGAREIVQTGLVLYGASSTGDRMVNYLRDMGLSGKIVAVVDSDEKKWGSNGTVMKCIRLKSWRILKTI